MPQNRLKNILKRVKLSEKLVSKILGSLVLVVIAVLVFNYFKGFKENNFLPEIENEQLAQEANQINLIEEKGIIVPDGLPKEYTIQNGEDLWKIAEKFYASGYNWVDLARENKITNPNLVTAGEKIILPKVEVKERTLSQEEKIAGAETKISIPEEIYTVKEGDYLWDIALRAYGDGYQWIKIARANNLTNPDIIHPGNKLIIP